MARYDAVLFDFDGTVYDTFPGISATLQQVLLEDFQQNHPNLNEFKQCIGPPIEWSFRELFGLDAEQTARAVKSFRTRYRVVCVDKSELYDGVKELLDTLQSSGITIGIASSKPNEMIIKILEHGGMRGYFPLISGIVSSDDHADKTTCIERALDVLGTAPGRVLMVGDRFYDAEGAQNAGVDFCAALYGGYAADDEFAPYPCVCGVQSPREIAEFVLG